MRTHIGYGSPRQDTYLAHGEPLGPDNVKKTKEELGWPLEPDFYVPDDVLAFYRAGRRKGRRARSARGRRRYDAWKTAQRRSTPRSSSARLRGERPADLPWPAFDAEQRQRRDARRRRHRDERDRESLPELVGGSADLDPSTKTYLKDCGDFEPNNYAGRNIHYGVREHAMVAVTNGIALHGGLLPFAATFFNFLDYCKPALRLACADRNALASSSSRTTRSFSAKTGRRTSRSSSWRCCARRRTATSSVRPTRSRCSKRGSSRSPRNGAPWVLVLTRQKLPFLGARDAAVSKGAYVLADADGGTPDLILIATGSEVSLAVDAKKILDAQGRRARASFRCRAGSCSTRSRSRISDAVLPPAVAARMSIEAGATIGWSQIRRRPRLRVRHRSLRRVGAGRRHRQGLRLHAGQRRPTRARHVRTRNPLGEIREETNCSNCSTPAKAFGSTTFAAACSPRASSNA